MTDLDRAKAYLADGYTCAVCREDHVFYSRERGVKPLLAWLDEGADQQPRNAPEMSAKRKAIGSNKFGHFCS
jgi:hypothetical protein